MRSSLTRGWFSPKLLPLILLTFTSVASAQLSPETAKISFRTISISRECADKFTYSYRPGLIEEAPLVVYFGGGPSSPTIGSNSFPVPPEFGLLRFDYPGVGRNESLVSCDSWSAQRIARTIVRILRAHSPTNYLVYGVSYGTVPATIAAALLEQDRHLLRPRLLLLESTIGRAYKPGEVIFSFKTQWQEVLKAIPDSVRKKIREETVKGCTPESWGAWAEHALSVGAGPGHRHLAEEMLLALSTQDAMLGFCAPESTVKVSSFARKAYRDLVCREISSTAPDHVSSFRLVDMALKPRAGNVCKPNSLDRPYDCANWLLKKTPIAYFIGTRDPATPKEHARYHSETQRNTSRILLEVPEAGHNPLSVTLADCATELFRSFMKSSNAVQQVRINSCSQKTLFKVLRPVQ